MRKLFIVSAVIVLLLVIVSWAWAERVLLDAIDEAKESPAAKELAVREKAFWENGNLVICEVKQVIPGHPQGVHPDTALALVRGTLPSYTAKDETKDKLSFTLPARLKQDIILSSRVISWQQGWSEKPETSLSTGHDMFVISFFAVLGLIAPFFAILVVSLSQKRKGRLFLFYAIILASSTIASTLSFLIGWYGGAFIGMLVGIFSGLWFGYRMAGVSGIFTAVLSGMSASIFAAQFTGGWASGLSGWLKASQYLLFVAACCLLSFLTAWAIESVASARKVRKLEAA